MTSASLPVPKPSDGATSCGVFLQQIPIPMTAPSNSAKACIIHGDRGGFIQGIIFALVNATQPYCKNDVPGQRGNNKESDPDGHESGALWVTGATKVSHMIAVHASIMDKLCKPDAASKIGCKRAPSNQA
jgi:hypothetical protein